MTHPKCDALDVLACPLDGLDLHFASSCLLCSDGHSYPIVEGVPVLLR